MAMATVMDDGVGWNPELEAKKREELRKRVEADPFFLIRQRFPKFERLDIPAEAQLIREKKSNLSAADRAYILRIADAYANRSRPVEQC